MKNKKTVECSDCKTQAKCCRMGAWVDLEEAKKILTLGIKDGDFFHMERDNGFPSGYKVGTSIEDESCTFLTRNGLCAIHKVDYGLKPSHCKEFPYENGKLSPISKYLCVIVKARYKKRKSRAGYK